MLPCCVWRLSCYDWIKPHHSSQQRWILKPVSKARDQTWVLVDTSLVHYCWATVGCPTDLFFSFSFLFFFLLVGATTQLFPGQISNLHHSCNQSQSSDNARSLTCWAARELLNMLIYWKGSNFQSPSVGFPSEGLPQWNSREVLHDCHKPTSEATITN